MRVMAVSVKGLGTAITPLTTQNSSQIQIGLSGRKSLKARGGSEEGRPQKTTSSFSLFTYSLHFHAPTLCVWSLCCLRSTRLPVVPLSWPLSFASFSVFPLSSLSPSKPACPEHWGASVLRLRERDENSKELSSYTHGHDLAFMSVSTWGGETWGGGGFLSVFSHLLVLRCRVENVPGRWASGC